MELLIDPEVRALGIDARLALVRGARISNRSAVLERRKKEALDAIRAVDAEAHPFLAAYRELHRLVGADGLLPPAQHLIRIVQGGGRLPNINTAVDAYNLVSAETGLSIGAHDLAHVRGDLALRMTTGAERYTPLGSDLPVPVRAGEYAGMDGEKILCRLDVKQCQETRLTKATTAFLVYVQGSRAVPPGELVRALERVGALLAEAGAGELAIAPTPAR